MKTNPNTNAKPSKNTESDTNKEPNFSFEDDTKELSDQDLMMIVGAESKTRNGGLPYGGVPWPENRH